ncbi:Hypothetical protein POVR1_LOCUS250 [uncultured virus]|nr:Hypothetical protein POVR1_LOCUS250 [uncultured virus]
MGTTSAKCLRHTHFQPSNEEFDVIYNQLLSNHLGPTHDLLISATRSGRYDIIAFLMTNSSLDITFNDHEALYEAMLMKQVGIIILLLSNPLSDPNRILTLACEMANDVVVGILLQNPKTDVTRNNQEGLKAAVAKNATQIVKLLLQHSQVNPMIDDGSVLELAATFGYLETFRLLLAHPGTQVMINHGAILKKAAANGRLEICQLILQGSPDLSEKSSPLNDLVHYNDLHTNDMTQALILAECSKNISFDPTGQNQLLITTALHGNPNLLRGLLMDARMTFKISSSIPGVSVLSESIFCDNDECISLLLEGAKQRKLLSYQWEYAITLAVNQQCHRFVKAMVEMDCKNFHPGFNDNSIIILTMMNNHSEMLETIMKCNRIDVGADSSRLLRYAVTHRKLACARVLITDVRVDPSAWNNSLLSSAISQNDLEMIDLLLADHRVKPSVDILSIAVKFQNLEAVKKLVVCPGMTVNETMFKNAIQGRNSEIVDLLLTLPSNDLTQVWKFCTTQGFHNFAEKIHDTIRKSIH